MDAEIRRIKIVTLIVSATILLLFIVMPLTFICYGCSMLSDELDENNDVELLGSYCSPHGKYTVDFYLWNGGATTAWGVKGYLIDNEKGADEKTVLFFQYDTREVTAKWISDYEILINGVILDVRHDIYD